MGPCTGVRTNAVVAPTPLAAMQPDTAVTNCPFGRVPGMSHTLLVSRGAVSAAPVEA